MVPSICGEVKPYTHFLFCVRCKDTTFGQAVAVVGSFCNWDPKYAVVMCCDEQTWPLWMSEPIPLDPFSENVEYKYIIVDRTNPRSCKIKWEQNANRKLHAGQVQRRASAGVSKLDMSLWKLWSECVASNLRGQTCTVMDECFGINSKCSLPVVKPPNSTAEANVSMTNKCPLSIEMPSELVALELSPLPIKTPRCLNSIELPSELTPSELVTLDLSPCPKVTEKCLSSIEAPSELTSSELESLESAVSEIAHSEVASDPDHKVQNQYDAAQTLDDLMLCSTANVNVLEQSEDQAASEAEINILEQSEEQAASEAEVSKAYVNVGALDRDPGSAADEASSCNRGRGYWQLEQGRWLKDADAMDSSCPGVGEEGMSRSDISCENETCSKDSSGLANWLSGSSKCSNECSGAHADLERDLLSGLNSCADDEGCSKDAECPEEPKAEKLNLASVFWL
eukprot:gnl/MRDRNA2_/MRDRNA2_222422_c0_seq1.p1 gnl/MRDRNA2_/MRDRNA2_222422_c0~~gnl/MRDRNA2_/MRDRNA2_222422_c0_seq1.p1  ORF type:complete len:454 (+),score=89.15 gnl/MRDRNA2_/MRDRNA2_222422_c0_seq1:106-1467(+)